MSPDKINDVNPVMKKISSVEAEENLVGVQHSHRCNETKKTIRKFINSITIQFLLFVFTIYALLGDDMRLFFFDKGSDPVFLTLNIITLLLFTSEIVLSSIGVSMYFGNFFFWLDLLSTVSLITDIEPLWNLITG